MTVTCVELVELIFEFVAEELDADCRAACEEHLCGCRTCVVSVELYRATVVVTRALPRCEAALPPGFEARMRAAVEAALRE